MKTQLLLLGASENLVVPENFKKYIVNELKVYGIHMKKSGMDIEKNWEKATEKINKLQKNLSLLEYPFMI